MNHNETMRLIKAKLLGRACAELMLATAFEILDAGGCTPDELSEDHTRWLAARFCSVGRTALDDAVKKSPAVFSAELNAAMATAGRQVAEEFLAVEWSRRN